MAKKLTAAEKMKLYKKSTSQWVDIGSNLKKKKSQDRELGLDEMQDVLDEEETHSNKDNRESIEGELSPNLMSRSQHKSTVHITNYFEKLDKWENYVGYYL